MQFYLFSLSFLSFRWVNFNLLLSFTAPHRFVSITPKQPESYKHDFVLF